MFPLLRQARFSQLLLRPEETGHTFRVRDSFLLRCFINSIRQLHHFRREMVFAAGCYPSLLSTLQELKTKAAVNEYLVEGKIMRCACRCISKLAFR